MRLTDFTFAVRNLLGRPSFALTAILLLALGAGANAAVFSVVRGILLRPLAYTEPDRLVAIWPGSFVSNEDLVYWRDRTHSFEGIAGISPGWLMSLVVPGSQPLKVTGGRVSDNFFATLGVSAANGRAIVPGDSMVGKTGVVVISAALHEQHFSADPRVIGRRMQLDGTEHEIVGVMPRGFEFMEPGTDVWAPLPFNPADPQHRATFSIAFARLRPGATVQLADKELQSLTPTMRADLKKTSEWGREGRVVLLREAVTGDVRQTLLILLAAVGTILLLAAVNLGTLSLSRSVERTREMAVRTALGASRWQLVRQLLAEQIVLASAGALAGLTFARAALPVLITRIPPEVPRQSDISMDWVVFVTVFAATVALSVVMTILPLAVTTRPQVQTLLRQHQSTETPARRRLLGSLVVAQVALAIVLGVGAGLMLRTLINLQRVDPGFTVDGVLTFRLQTTARRLNLPQGLAYFEQVLDRVRALPGVQSVGAIQHLPMSGYNWTSNVWPVERPPAPGSEPPRATWRFIGWDYFRTMEITLRAGRPFDARDHLKSPAVAIVNDAFARREFGDATSAIGRRLATRSGRGDEVVEIVGVSSDVRFLSLNTPATPEIYRPLSQTFMFPMAFVVRTTEDPTALAASVRQAAFAVDETIPVAELQPLSSLVAGSLGRPKLLAMLLTLFAAAGLALGVVGVYGVVAYRVRQQQRDFGIRLALGAPPPRIARSVIRQGAQYALVGIAIGISIALVATRLLQSTVFGITPRDPLTFTALPLAVTAAILLACSVPAWRAARVDPMTSMRAD
jgi:predicted permease